MKKTKLFVCAALLILMVCSMLPAVAQYPDDLSFIPITNPDVWEAEGEATGTYLPFGSAKTFVKTTINGDGSLVMQKTADSPEGMNWPRIRTVFLEEPVAIDLSKTPYLYYDFTVEGDATQWAIGMIFEGGAVDISLAKQINADQGLPALEGDDGVAGVYKGRVDLNKIIEEKGSAVLKPNTIVDLAVFQIFIVVPNNEGTITVRSMYIGGENDGDGNTDKPTTTVAPTTQPTKDTKNPDSGDPGVLLVALSGVAGLAGVGILSKKRK